MSFLDQLPAHTGSLTGKKILLTDDAGGDESLLDPADLPALSASGGNRSVSLNSQITERLLFNYPQPLDIPVRASNQPDGSSPITTSDLVHCQRLRFEKPQWGYQFWAVVNPYPAGDPTYENPSIIVSHDGKNWTEHPQMQNPITPYPVNSTTQGDPTIDYDESLNRLVISYLRRASDGTREIRQIHCGDGLTWSDPVILFTSSNPMGSPSMVWHNQTAKWRMYVGEVLTGVFDLAYYESDSIYGGWTGPTECVENNLPFQYNKWDGQVYNIGGSYITVTSICKGTGGASAAMTIATSEDGDTWTYQNGFTLNPDLTSSDEFFNSLIYTPDALPREINGKSVLDVMISGRSQSNQWRLALVDAYFANDVVVPPSDIRLLSQVGQTVDGSNIITASTLTGEHYQNIDTLAENLGGVTLLNGAFSFARESTTAGDWLKWESASIPVGDRSMIIEYEIPINVLANRFEVIGYFGSVLIGIRGDGTFGNTLSCSVFKDGAVEPLGAMTGATAATRHRLGVTVKDDTVTFFNDQGQLLSKTYTTALPDVARLILGGGAGFWTGKIFNVEIWDSALSQLQMKAKLEL